MLLPKRFALSTLLLLILAVASVFGYAQWRRQWLKAEVVRLQKMGAWAVALKDAWFWPTVSEGGVAVFFKLESDGAIACEGVRFTEDESRAYFESVRTDLYRIGVKDVSYYLGDKNGRPLKHRRIGY
jgi:hypothetical protein